MNRIILFFLGMFLLQDPWHSALAQKLDANETSVPPHWSDAGRCGTNALYILVNLLKEEDVPYSVIANEIEVSSFGSSLADLADASGRIGLRLECLMVSKEQLARLPTPYLMHLDLIEQGGIGHFITVVDQYDDAHGFYLRFVDGGDGETKTVEINNLKGSYSGFVLAPLNRGRIWQKSVMLVLALSFGVLLSSIFFKPRVGK